MQSGFAFDVSAADGRALYAAAVPPEAFSAPVRRGRRLRYRLARRAARSLAPDVRRLVVTVDDAGVADVWLVAVTDALEVIAAARMVSAPQLAQLRAEGRELLAIFSATVGTARHNARSGV